MNRNQAATRAAVENLPVLVSVLTCPSCGAQHRETMPTDACQFLYACRSCNTLLKPLNGDCCVFCSYGTVPCPPRQSGCCAQDGRGCGS